ncbi:hypothetical protein [Caldisericum sp.]
MQELKRFKKNLIVFVLISVFLVFLAYSF